MKKVRLPPLHLLQAFEAAGQHLSFKRAAEELHLTPSAISHHIKRLEEILGFALFKRMNRALTLTEGGQAYLRVVNEAFNQLRRGTSQTLQHFGQPTLRTSVLPFMASEVIIPNLESFKRQHPNIELRLETSLRWIDFEHDDMDMAIRYGNGNWPGLVSERLTNITVTPFCSPQYQADMQIRTPEDINRCTLIHVSSVPDGWQRWCTMHNTELKGNAGELYMDNYPAILQAAERGLGVCLGMLPLTHAWLQTGRLVAPLDTRDTLEEAFYLIYRERDKDRPELQAFRNWLLDQFEFFNQAH